MSIAKPTNTELRELFGLAEPRRIKSIYYPNPIRLSKSHVNSLLVHLGDPADPNRRRILAKEIEEAAEFFLYDVAIQSAQTPSESLKQLKSIESAAGKLRAALKWHGESIETIPYEPVHTWLRQAAEKYRDHVKLPADVSPYDVPWNYWEAWALPRAIAGISLLELWAKEASALVTRTSDTKRRGAARKHALRVTIHRLALCWLHAFGKAPGAGIRVVEKRAIKAKDQYIADGPFIRFAISFFEGMKQCTNDKQMSDYPQLKKLLKPSRDTIRKYLQQFKTRLKGKAGKAK